MGKWRWIVVVAGAVGVLGAREASACDGSGWQLKQLDSVCLEVRGVDDTFRAGNFCGSSLTLKAEVCPNACPAPVEIAPGDDALLALPNEAESNDTFRFESSEGDVVRFSYVKNECPETDGCSLGPRGRRSGIGPLLAGLALLGFRHLRRREAESRRALVRRGLSCGRAI